MVGRLNAPYGDDRYLETRGDHADARLESVDRAGLGAASFGESLPGCLLRVVAAGADV